MERESAVALFDGLYQQHARALHAFLLGHTGDEGRSEDLLQDTFLRAWRHLAEVRAIPEERRRFWLFRVARNCLYDDQRRRAARPTASDDALDGCEDGAATALRQRLEETIDVDRAVAGLPPPLRTVLAMSLLGEMTSVEIGDALGRPPGTIRYQLAEARRLLAEALGLSAQNEPPMSLAQEPS